MSKENKPVESNELSSGLGNNDTLNSSSRQEVISPRTINYQGLPFDGWASVATFIKYNREVQSDPKFRAYTPLRFLERLNQAVKTLSGSRALRYAGAAFLAVTGASILADNHPSEASNIKPLDSDGLGYTPLFPHGEMVVHAHDSHDHHFNPAGSLLRATDTDLPQLLDSSQFVTYSGGGFTATRIWGDGAPTDLSYLIVGQGYNDQQLLNSAQLYGSNLLAIEPFKSQQDNISISVLHMQNVPDLGSTVQNPLGDDAKVQKLIDDVNIALGSYQETRLLLNHLGIRALAYIDPSIPTIYSHAAFTEGRLRSTSLEGGIAHEEGHAMGGAGEAYYSSMATHGPNVYINCLTADQIPIRWKGIPGAPGAIYEGCGNTLTGVFRDAERDVMRNYSGVENPTYGPATLWQLNHRLEGAPAIYYPPTLLSPAENITLNGLGANLAFNPSEMTRQFQVQVTPYNNDGPGINLIIGDSKMIQKGSFNILPPVLGVGNYVMLPDLTYTWRIRQTSAEKPVGENDPVWSGWSEEHKFRTPKADSSTLSLPGSDDIRVASLPRTPFVWNDTNKNIFYYEVQVSGNNKFDTNPQTATSFVWGNLIHGGMTEPLNSWKAPGLEPNSTYYWRVRPRVQGDGNPVEWGPVWSFRTNSNPDSFVASQELAAP